MSYSKRRAYSLSQKALKPIATAAVLAVAGPAMAAPALFFDFNLDRGRTRLQDTLGLATAPVVDGGGTVEVFEYNFADNTASNPQQTITVTGSMGTEVVVQFNNYNFNGGTPGGTVFDYNFSGGGGVNGYSVSYPTPIQGGGPDLDVWREVVVESFQMAFFEADGTTPLQMNAIGMEVNDWGTCCTELDNILPSGLRYDDGGEAEGGTAVFAVFNPYTLTGGVPDLASIPTGTDPRINVIGNITQTTGRGLIFPATIQDNGTLADGTSINSNNHFVAAINDSNLFDSIAIVPNGRGEFFGFGGILYFARVEPGSVPAGQSGVELGTTAQDADGDGINDDTDPFPNADTASDGTSGGRNISLTTTPDDMNSTCTLDDTAFISQIPVPDTNEYISSGLGVGYQLTGCDVGETITINLDFGTRLPGGALIHEVDDSDMWSEPLPGVTKDGDVFTYTVTDGGPGDLDGVANGVIVGRKAASLPRGGPEQIPTLPLAWLLFSMLAVGGLGVRRLRR